MNKLCDLCNGTYDFRRVMIENVGITGIEISFPSSLQNVTGHNRFRYCPLCGKELTIENFKYQPLKEV